MTNREWIPEYVENASMDSRVRDMGVGWERGIFGDLIGNIIHSDPLCSLLIERVCKGIEGKIKIYPDPEVDGGPTVVLVGKRVRAELYYSQLFIYTRVLLDGYKGIKRYTRQNSCRSFKPWITDVIRTL